MYFVDDRGEFYSKGDGSETSVVYDQDDYPPHCEVSVDKIQASIIDFLRTGDKPTSVEWQAKVLPTTAASES
ncbi:MAG: Imm1 family immunity protein [Actinomycetota bacterium]|nr:Imm1 family immunity protein [Actinomycetota bacterium]